MLYCRHESLFTRLTATSHASGRCRTEPGRDCQDVCGLGGDDQTLSQTTTRDRSRFAKSDPRPSCADQCGVAGPLESVVRSPSRCDPRRTLLAVPSRTWHRGEYGQHQSRQSFPGLDAKKTLGWQAYLEEDVLKSCEVGSRILAESQLLATRLAPKGELLTQGIPRLEIVQDQDAW